MTSGSGYVWVAIASALAGCASPSGGPREMSASLLPSVATGATSSRAASDRLTGEELGSGTVIGKLKLRDSELVILAARGTEPSPQFALLDRQGNLLGKLGSEVELQVQFPELHQAYKNSVAQGTPLLDARIDPTWRAESRSIERNEDPLTRASR